MLTQDNFVLVKTNSHNVVIIFVERHTLNVIYIYIYIYIWNKDEYE